MAKFDIILKGTGEEDSKRPSRMQQSLNSELILSKEQLYDMFQQILSVKKFEHQILFNALMVSKRGGNNATFLFKIKRCYFIKNSRLLYPFIKVESSIEIRDICSNLFRYVSPSLPYNF